MRALVIHAPHDLRLEAFAGEAGAPGPGEVRVRLAAGGICGSDLHYYHHGGFGTVRIKEPMALGHEVSGQIEALGAGVSGVAVGDLVAINPSVPCDVCPACRAGHRNHCADMRFNGSAMRFPHVQGLFREAITVPVARAVPVGAEVTAAEAALCEPFAVALHAVKQAGAITGRTVLVSGCGPIGVLVVAAARLAGASRIIATDVTAHSLAVAGRLGATDLLDVGADPEALSRFVEREGRIETALECSGNPRAIASVIGAMAPRGRLVLVGLGGEAPLPLNAIVAKELQISGTFRFDAEFGEAARLIAGRRVDLRPMLSAIYPLEKAADAFSHAGDRTRGTKVSISLSPAGSAP